MAEINAWLEEVSSSPYAAQLARGFALLRFEKPLEAEFRQFSQRQNYHLRLWYLYFAIAMWLLFAVADQLWAQSGERWWMLLVRMLSLGILISMVRPLQQLKDERKVDRIVIGLLLVLGGGAAVIVAIGHSADQEYPYEGLLLIIFSIYFLTGLRLGQALSVSLLLVVFYALLDIWAGYPPAVLVQNLLFLMSGNLVGAMGSYLLEYKSREHFLNHHLMRELADHDSLTGLHNRRSFNRKFEKLWRQAQRENSELALLLCDVDHFKAFNDCYGHQAGDIALRKLGQVIGNTARRPLDIAVRMGGEEFAVLLYGMNEAQALTHADAMRTAVLALGIDHARSTTAAVLSVSVGLACVSPEVAKPMSMLYERADKALYQAKASGRNRVVQWERRP